MSFFKHAVQNTIGSFASAFLLLLAGVITARFLGPEGRGFYAVFFTTAGLLARLFYFGISTANVYLLNREKKPYSIIFGNSVLFIACHALLLAVILSLFEGVFEGIFPGRDIEKIIFFLWMAVVLHTTSEMFFCFLLGHARYTLYALCTFVTAVCVFLTSLIVFWNPDSDVATSWRVLGCCAVVPFLVFMIIKLTKPAFAVSWSVFREQICFGVKNHINNIAGILNYRLYLLVISFLHGHEMAGLFSVAILFVEPIRMLPNAIGPVLLSYLSKEECEVSHKMLTAQTCRIILAMVALGMLLYVPIVPHLLYYVFGELYVAALGAIWIMLIGGVLAVVYQVMTRHFTSRNLQRYSIIASASSLFVAAISVSLLVPKFGLVGGAFAYLLSSFSSFLIMLYLYARSTKMPLHKVLFVQREDFVNLSCLLRMATAKSL